MDFPNNDGFGNSPGRRIDFFPNDGLRQFPNDGLQQPANPPPFASTPAIARAQRPRFAYTGPPNYPRPGSSASKPNPSSFSHLMRSRYVPTDSLSDSMMNNFGDSSYMDVSYIQDRSFASEYSSHNESMDSSVYYSCNDTFSGSPKKNFPLLDLPYMQQAAAAGRSGSFQSTPQSSQKQQFKAPSAARFNKKPKPYAKPPPPGNKSDWRCELCNIDFTSRVPFAMHFQGQKHAKKLKLKEALKSIQSQVKEKDIVTIGSLFRCDICGTVANSSFQLQTHLDGLKHKAKVAQLAKEEEEKNNPKGKSNAEETNTSDAVPGERSDKPKPNGSKKKKVPKEKAAPISVLPTDVSSEEMQILKPPLAVQTVFTCAICDITLNSEAQHQQHMLGKYHKAKVEGKPVPWKRNQPNKVGILKKKKPSSEKVLGVKSLESSFVKGDVLK
ncbi:hypothetical protein JTE90_005293 [Oedothorax gibbosus]|uniref:C2H2-type domain-containing protein n=1 Tax=Oedothorax gibbosus TaxID=931172 RepID=A0AAV6U338_9ARAC|nr:hypothetical protein JTE90_005293 [Oedothorax gibbosus]